MLPTNADIVAFNALRTIEALPHTLVGMNIVAYGLTAVSRRSRSVGMSIEAAYTVKIKHGAAEQRRSARRNLLSNIVFDELVRAPAA
jgi:hypothetical protein